MTVPLPRESNRGGGWAPGQRETGRLAEAGGEQGGAGGAATRRFVSTPDGAPAGLCSFATFSLVEAPTAGSSRPAQGSSTSAVLVSPAGAIPVPHLAGRSTGRGEPTCRWMNWLWLRIDG
jgi:hypothetical protein